MPKRTSKKINNSIRLGIFWALVVFVTLAVWAFTSPRTELESVSISQVITQANAGELAKIEGQGDDLQITEKGKDKPTQKSFIQGGVSTLLRDNVLNET
ncbi:MAG: ATP-dependent metallopeptidase FtsH/Yme1/Tma family protein, partial [Candidatus Saccharimonas sp.]